VYGQATYNSSEHGQLAIIPASGKNATIFLSYCSSQPGQFGVTGVVSVVPTLYQEICTPYNGGTACHSSNVTQGVSISAFPSKLFVGSQTGAVVAVTISAGSKTTGHYEIGIPYSCPDPLLAIGYQPQQLTSADFGGLGITPCPFSSIGAGIIGVVGANLTYVGF
jgi:hypothetical protein